MDKQEGHTSRIQNTSDYPTQRALVLQGGGALGAYQVGAIKSLYKILSKEDEINHRQGRPLFDIVAGTSMGAMNAAILVSNIVVKNKSWEDSINELESFWTDIDKGVPANPKDLNVIKQLPWYTPWQKRNEKEGEMTEQQRKVAWHEKIPSSASEEAARRHYSVKFLSLVGMREKVFSPPITVPDYKFFDPDEKWYLFTNEGLRNTIRKYADFPIPSSGTSNEEGEQKEIPPRLLITSVDVSEGVTVTFDSYRKPDGTRKSEYGKEEGKTEYKHVIKYPGITLEHVMASGTIPQLYFTQMIDGRKFWDGGLLSNTPFRELLESYKEYWIDKVSKKEKDKIPNLEVYIVNVHPSKGDINPIIYDDVKNRENNIVYGDRSSGHDQKVALTMMDYINIINDLKELALKHLKEDERKAFEREFEGSLITKDAIRSSAIRGKNQKYGDLLMGAFELTKVLRIERKDDENAVSHKTADFTLDTIKALITQGENDALSALGSSIKSSI